MYKIFDNKIFRVLMCTVLIIVFAIVPLEHKILEADASFTASVAISVICAILVAIGFTFGRAFLSDNIDSSFADYSITQTAQALRNLAADIYENCPGIYGALTACFPNGFNGFMTTRQIIQVAPALVQMIKKYIINTYGDTAEEIEDSINGTYGIVGDPFLYGDYLFFRSVSDRSTVLGYPSYSSVIVNGYKFNWELSSVTNYGVYKYDAVYTNASGTRYKLNTYETTDPDSLSIIPLYNSIDSSYGTYGSFSCVFAYVFKDRSGEMTYVRSTSFVFMFKNQLEHDNAVKAYAGETNPDNMLKHVEVDEDVLTSSSYPNYVYIYENADDYIGQTTNDVAAPAYSDIYDSNVVNSATRTISWQGDRTLCPIDELQASIPDAVIGLWNATWDSTSNLCNISCYAEDGTLTWTGEIATTLTWSDILSRLGDISISGTVTGSFAVADAALDFEPLKIAGDTFSKKFPFCLPFDLYRAFLQFNTEEVAEAPVFIVPFDMGPLGDYSITIDLSRFNEQATIVKWFLYIMFMIGLVVVTKKVLGGGS